MPAPALALTGRVVDAADIIPPDVEAKLIADLAELERKAGPQMVVATTPSLKEQDINLYTLDLARSWRLGDARRNDGLVLLVAPNERKVRIEVGIGLGSTLPDEECARIIREDFVPRASRGDLTGAIIKSSEDLIARLNARPTLPRVRGDH